jgi:hypothetical protein
MEKQLIEFAYQIGLIDDNEVKEKIEALNHHRQRFQSRIDELKVSEGAWEVSSDEITAIIGNINIEINPADPKIKKSRSGSLS